MPNFREELDKILDCNKITVKKIYQEVLHKLQRMDSLDLSKVKLLEFSVDKNKIYVFTIKTVPYSRKELQSFELVNPKNAATIFNELHNKLKADGCKFKDVSETNFSVII